MKKTFIVLFVLAVLLMPLIVSCSEDKIDKIAELVAKFSGLYEEPSAEEVALETATAKTETINTFNKTTDTNYTFVQKYEDILKTLNDNSAANLDEQTSIEMSTIAAEAKEYSDGVQSNILSSIGNLVTTPTNFADAKNNIKNADTSKLSNEIKTVLCNAVDVISSLSSVSTEGNATLGDLKAVSASISVANAVTKVLDSVSPLLSGNASEDAITNLLGDEEFITAISNMDTAMASYSTTVEGAKEEDYSIMDKLMSLKG